MVKDISELSTWLERFAVVNASGTMTHLGASRVSGEVADVVRASLPRFVDIDRLQAEASRVIARATGAEAGCVTASAAAGICISVAAAMTGDDVGAAQALPQPASMKGSGVVLQAGHVVDYGGTIHQNLRLVGGRPIEVGTVSGVHADQLAFAVRDPDVVAGVFVISHHTVQSEQLDLRTFAEICHEHDTVVIVDAASEYDLRTFVEAGADLVVYSAHKFLGGPTAGIVAGREDLVRAAYVHQTVGVGRVMKVGKEGIVGAMAALLRWSALDHGELHEHEYRRLERLRDGLAARPELTVEEVPDPTGNPITRLRVRFVGARPDAVAWLADELKAGKPAVFVRDHHVDNGFFDLDPCNLDDDEAETLLARVQDVLEGGSPPVIGDDATRQLGPRRSRYDDRQQPRVDEDRVPFLISRASARQDTFARWPYGEPS